MLWGKAMGYRIEKESELVFVLREGTKGGGGGDQLFFVFLKNTVGTIANDSDWFQIWQLLL